jgi:hypothetical protein
MPSTGVEEYIAAARDQADAYCSATTQPKGSTPTSTATQM